MYLTHICRHKLGAFESAYERLREKASNFLFSIKQ